MQEVAQLGPWDQKDHFYRPCKQPVRSCPLASRTLHSFTILYSLNQRIDQVQGQMRRTVGLHRSPRLIDSIAQAPHR